MACNGNSVIPRREHPGPQKACCFIQFTAAIRCRLWLLGDGAGQLNALRSPSNWGSWAPLTGLGLKEYASRGHEAPERRRRMTKGLLLGALALVTLGITAPAIAADLPARTYTKAPDMGPVAYDWSGGFVGLNGGWGTANRCFDQTAPVVGAEGCHGTSGGFAGGQLGYRWQMSSWVFGFEGRGDG